MLTWGKEYWPVFLLISSGWIITGFGIPELIALFTRVSTHTDNTLSNYSHVELGVSAHMTIHTIVWYVTLITVVVLFAVLVGHIWFEVPE